MQLKLGYIGCALFFSVVAYFLQACMLFNGDVGYLLHVTKSVLTGGVYLKDFMETNPPLIFYLYTPVVLLVDWMSLDYAVVFHWYTIILILISLICSYCLLEKILADENNRYLLPGLFGTLLLALFFLPAYEFGQREHYLMILALPYIFAAVLAVQRKKINLYFALLIGVMAGLGFGMKPYFLLPLILIESYLIYVRRRLFGWVRVESITCFVVLVSYLLSVIIYQPNYIYKILPLVSQFYFTGISELWLDILSRPSVIFCLIVMGYYFLYYDKKFCCALSIILVLTLIGMIAAFVITRSAWYYHVLPALTIACFLMTLYVYQIAIFKLRIDKHSLSDTVFLISITIVLFYTPIFYAYGYTKKMIFAANSKQYLELQTYVTKFHSLRSIYCFAVISTVNCFPLVYKTQSQFVGRFPMFWWLRGLLQIERAHNNAGLPNKIIEEKKYLINQVAYDLEINQPEIIIINQYDENTFLEKNGGYVGYFSHNTNFAKAWLHYKYVTSIGNYKLYGRIIS